MDKVTHQAEINRNLQEVKKKKETQGSEKPMGLLMKP